jgi:hypothetical protein
VLLLSRLFDGYQVDQTNMNSRDSVDLERPMTAHDIPPPPDGFFFRWGNFEIGASGKLVVILAATATAAYLTRAWGLW